jgi:hypothetical protein
MKSISGLLGGTMVLALSTSASAAIITFTQQNVWQNFSTNQGAGLYSETFSGVSDGFYAAYSGSTGPVNWSASAVGGLYVSGGLFSTNNPQPLTFDFVAGVNGVAGNFFATDINFLVIPALVTLRLNDGSSFIGFIDSATAYTGFYSNAALITSIRIEAVSAGTGDAYPTTDNLQFAVVPAPGAIALLGLAGLVARRRR